MVLIFGIFPFYQYAKDLDDTTERVAHNALIEFVDTVRGKGYVDVRDYEVFQSKLDDTGTIYDVTLEYYRKVLEPNYTNPYNINTFQGSFEVRYDGYYTNQILKVLYPNNNLPTDAVERRLNMKVGDQFNVRIEPKGTSLAAQISNAIFNVSSGISPDRYGGMVRSEAP